MAMANKISGFLNSKIVKTDVGEESSKQVVNE